MTGSSGETAPTTQAERLVPTWLENIAALGWRVLVIVAFAALLWYLGTLIWNVVAAIGLAVIVAVVLAPVVLWLRASGRTRTAAAGITWVVAIGAVLGLLLLVSLSVLPYLAELLQQLQGGSQSLDAWLSAQGLPEWLGELAGQLVLTAEGLGEDAVATIAGSVANLAGILLLGSFLLFFFLRDGDLAWLWLFQSMPGEKRERITSAGDDALARVGRYVRATTLTSALAAISSLAFMLVLGTPLAVPLATLSFVLGFIPWFGGVMAALLVVLVTYGAVDGTAALVMVALLVARWLVLRLAVQPRLHRQALTLHPVIILVVLPVGFQLGGLIGLILAVPLTAVGLSVAQAAIDIIEPEAPEDLPGMVPAWLDRAAQWSWRAIVAIAFVALVTAALVNVPLVLLPVILALILAATVLPLVGALVERGLARGTAVAAAVGGSTVAVVGVLALALASLVNQAGEVGDTAVDGAETVDEAAGGMLGLGSDAIQAGVDAGVRLISGMSGDLVGIALVVTLAVLLAFFFLRDGAGLWDALMSHLPVEARAELSGAGKRAFGVLGGYMIGTGAISFVGAASQAVIMWVLDMPLVLPIFVLSLFGGFIPYIGSLLTTGLALLVAISVGDTVDIMVMLAWTALFNIVQGNVVAPMVYSRTTHIHPAIVLASIPAGSAVADILGMFLVVPALGVISVSWRSVLRIMGDGEGPAEVVPENEGTPGLPAEAEPA